MRAFRVVLKPARPSAATAFILAAAAALAPSAVFADKLVVFKNGKSIRAKGIQKEAKGWTRLELDGGNSMGVRTSQILGVEEAGTAGPGKAESVPNQATTGGGGGYVPPPAAYSPRAEAQEPAAEGGDDFQQAPQELEPPPQPPQDRPPVAIPGARPFDQQLQQPQSRGFRRNRVGNVQPGALRQPVSPIGPGGARSPRRGVRDTTGEEE